MIPCCLRGRPRSCIASFQALQGEVPGDGAYWGSYVDHRLDYPGRLQGH